MSCLTMIEAGDLAVLAARAAAALTW